MELLAAELLPSNCNHIEQRSVRNTCLQGHRGRSVKHSSLVLKTCDTQCQSASGASRHLPDLPLRKLQSTHSSMASEEH